MKEVFIWSDAWILLAIIYSDREGGASLPAIAYAADYINHAIPTEDEINGAQRRLQHAGFVDENDGKFRASAMTLEAYAHTHTPRRYVYKELEDMQRLLGIQVHEH